jgi:magnesium-dependent phosphatase 1
MLIVFDLDFTLWDAGGTWCDHLTPPFRRKGPYVTDAYGERVCLYPDVRAILQWCQENEHSVGLASRTGEPTWAKRILDLFELRDIFDYEQIYPGCKEQHFRKLRHQSGVSYQEMVFFDDEYRNIQDVQALGVRAIHVHQGVSWPLFWEALEGH